MWYSYAWNRWYSLTRILQLNPWFEIRGVLHIAELDEKDKSIVFGMIETMLTKKKFKDFFNNNIAAL